ncbi:MAG: hypothetical protein H7330_09735 [Hymenobacteraceae bacterium]|nr:hypothetical protein [Hymenobacteraceae bacterium]
MSDPSEILYSTDAVRIRWFSADQLLEFTWLSFVSGEELHEAFNRMLELSPTLGATRWLTDFTAMSAMRLADQDWIVEHYTPRLSQQITLHRSAMVRPDHSLGAYFLNSMIARISAARSWPLRGFGTRAAAYAWLMHPTEPSEPAPATPISV